jgi:hypothetical protein
MSFNRLNYDSCSYKQDIYESIGPGNYQLGTPPIDCEYCFPMPPTVRMQGTGVSIKRSQPLVDQHSELLNITRKASKCCEKQWSQNCNHCGWLSLEKYPTCQPNGFCSACNQTTESKHVTNTHKKESFTNGALEISGYTQHFKSCFIPQESSRLMDAPCTLRGTGIDRFTSEILFECPQSNCLVPFDYNIDNRIVTKTNHRPCVPTPLDQRKALPPKPLPLPCDKIKANCGNHTYPESAQFAWRNVKNYN